MLVIALLATLAISLVSLVGLFSFKASEDKIKKLSFWLVSLAAGTMLGDVFIHLLPEITQKNTTNTWFFVIIGIIIFFILEKFIHWRHCHVPTSQDHPHPVGTMNLIGDALHNFFDGILVAGSFMVSLPLGLTTSLAVLLHEIPQEIGDFGVLIHAGYTKAKAILFNFFSALTALLGTLILFLIKQPTGKIENIIIPITAGAFLYIAMADLLPELHKETKLKKSFGQLILLISGIIIMYLLKIYFL